MSPKSYWVTALLIVLSSRPVAGSPRDILISEVNYSPFSGETRDEFIEIYNRGPTPVDLSGWSFTDGVSFVFPFGTLIGGGEYLIVSPAAERARAYYGIENVVGDWAGKLDNAGELLVLADGNGAPVSKVPYGSGGAWPDHPAGLGPTLELYAPFSPWPDLPRSWASSLFLEGTPGRRNSRMIGERSTRAIVQSAGSFHIFKGTTSPVGDWTRPDFDDSGWAVANGSFGFGSSFAGGTRLDDMAGAYTTFIIRARFDLDPPTLADIRSGALVLTFRALVNDGFVAYLGGQEIARSNLGAAGNVPAYDAVADTIGGTTAASIPLGGRTDLFGERGNVLAVMGAAASTSDVDFLLEVYLELAPGKTEIGEFRPEAVINEVLPSEPPGHAGFIELYNRGAAAQDLGGWWIVAPGGSRFQIPAGTVLEAGNLATFDEAALGFGPSPVGGRYALLAPDGVTWRQGLDARPGPPGASFGSFPDGDGDTFVLAEPTRDGPNRLTLETAVIINEICYHPAFVAPSGDCTRQCSDPDQWIEIHNRGGADVDLSGWSLSKAVDFQFLGGTTIRAGGFLVVAADRDRFLANHLAVDPTIVLGPWQRYLGRGSDTINLRDAVGNRVNHVEYGDGSPANDLNPDDGIDDGTMAGSDWPSGADLKTGQTLELTHPGLDNRAGTAWAAGPVGGTPGAANATLAADPPPVIWTVENDPVLPRSTEAVRVTCRASSQGPISKVEVLYRVNGGDETTVVLLDDGLSDDGIAGDGKYGGLIPPQAHDRVVSYQVRVETSLGRTAVAPRPPFVKPYAAFQGPHFLYQVNDGGDLSNGSPTFRIVMAPADLTEFRNRAVTSNVLLPCTVIADGKAWHRAGIRLRGSTMRNQTRKSYRIEFPPERKFRGVELLNLNSSNIYLEYANAELFRRAALPSLYAYPANVVFHASADPLYVVKENYDGDFLERFFGGSDGGNLYRPIDPDPPGGTPQGNLSFFGRNTAALATYRQVYVKRSNKEEADWSDVVELTAAFDTGETSDAQFVDRVESLIDPYQWAAFFAVMDCITDNDGGIWNSTGEDYFLYHVPAASSRPDAGKWLILPWDLDESYTDDNDALMPASIASVRRFLRHPAFTPIYYDALTALKEGPFSRARMRECLAVIEPVVGAGRIDTMDAYIRDRISYIDSVVSEVFTVGIQKASGSGMIGLGEVWKYFKGRSEPSGGTLAWAEVAFDDGAWLEGATPIGFGDNGIVTVIDDMQDNYSTLYARKTFQVPDPASVGALTLQIDFDDGFVAYLNGVEVARGNIEGQEGSLVPFDFTTGNRHETGTTERFDLSGRRGLLVPGTNVLAILVANNNLGSGDVSLFPELLTSDNPQGVGCGSTLYASASSIQLAGRAPVGRTHAVRVGGSPAAFDAVAGQWTAIAPLGPGENVLPIELVDGNGYVFRAVDVRVLRLPRPFTDVAGTLAGDATWTEAGGPYLATSTVTVPAGAKLTIEAGAIVVLQAGSAIVVRGSLEAAGTAAAPISIGPYSCSSRHGGIFFDRTGAGAGDPMSVLRFVDVEFGMRASGAEGTIAVNVGRLIVEDCSIRDTDGPAIAATGSSLEVRRTLIEDVAMGISAKTSLAVIADSTVSGVRKGGAAIHIESGLASGERSKVSGCLVEGGVARGIELVGAAADVEDTIAREFEDGGVRIDGKGLGDPPALTGDIIYGCGAGLVLLNRGAAAGSHATIVGNRTGIDLSVRGAVEGEAVRLHSSILWDNLAQIRSGSKSYASFDYTDLYETWGGEGNISADPRFVDPLREDFSLANGSPAIGAGKDGTDMGAVPREVAVLFIRGDSDSSGKLDLSDAISALDYMYLGGAGPACLDRIDGNDDGKTDLTDPVFVLEHLFLGGVQPPPPFPEPGPDPTPDDLPCA